MGVVLYQVASGRLPFAGKTSAVIFHEILGDVPAPLLKESPELPPKLAELIERLLEKDPELRYQSAADLRSDLKRMRRELESRFDLPARPSGVVERTSEKKTSVRMTAALLAVTAAVAAGVGVYALKFGKATPPFANYEMKKLTQSGDVELAALSPDGRYLLSVKAGQGKESLWLRNIPTNSDAQVIPPAEERYRSLQFSPDGDYIFFVRDAGLGVQDLFRAPVLGGEPKRLVHDVESNVSFSPDGTRMAFVRRHASPEAAETAQYDVVIAGVNGESERTQHTHDVALWESVSWSPAGDGRTLASAAMVSKSSLGKILTIDAETGAEKELFASDRLSANDCLWLPDGRGLLVLYKDKETGFSKGQIGYVRYPQGDFAPITRDTDDYGSLSLSADGKQLATVEHLSNFNIEVAEMIGNLPAAAKVVGSHEMAKYVSWTPAGDLLLDQGSKLVSANAAGAGRKTLLDDPLHRYVTGAVSCTGGKYVVFTSIDQAANLSNVWRMGKDGGDLKQLTNGINDFAQFCSQDGRWVYYLDETTNGISRVPIEGGKTVSLAGPRENSIASLSPDGLYFTRFAFVGGKEKLVVANAETGAVVRSFDHDPRLASFSQAPRFTPDERAIAYVIRDDGIDNLYAQPLDGSKGKILTQFSSGHIRDFAWSVDGRQIAMVRGGYDSDVVLLRNVPK
jgi:Tol biopolymer transport system component